MNRVLRKRVAFVVLHYLSADLTTACVRSILALEDRNGELEPCVVVVDNGSPNDSGEVVRKSFADDERVRCLVNKSNVGFSRANNTGYQAAVRIFEPRHVVILNNDTVVEQSDFLEVLECSYRNRGYPFVIGPDIYVRRKKYHQSPIASTMQTKEHVLRRLNRYTYEEEHGGVPEGYLGKLRYAMCRFGVGRRIVQNNDLRLLRMFSGWAAPADDCVLHGAAIVFTHRFVDTHELPFDPQTFLYEEELILALRCAGNGWRMCYEPRLQIIHYDDGSTDLATEDYYKKQAFIRKNEIDSINVLLDYWNATEQECDADS